MDWMKKLTTFVVGGSLVFALAACGAKTPEAEVAQALEKVAEAESITSVIDVDMKVSVNGSVSEEKDQASTNIVYQPFSVKIVNKSRIGLPSEIVTETYAEGSGDTVTAYMQYDNQWMKQNVKQADFLDSLQMYDTRENMQTVIKSIEKWEQVSKKNKILTLKGTLPAAKVSQVLESTRALQMVGMTGLTEEYYKGVPDVEVTLELDETTHLPKSYSADLSNVLKILMDNVMASFSEGTDSSTTDKLEVSKYNIHVECSDIGKTQKVNIPPEALKSAVDFEQQMQAYTDNQVTTDKAATDETADTQKLEGTSEAETE